MSSRASSKRSKRTRPCRQILELKRSRHVEPTRQTRPRDKGNSSDKKRACGCALPEHFGRRRPACGGPGHFGFVSVSIRCSAEHPVGPRQYVEDAEWDHPCQRHHRFAGASNPGRRAKCIDNSIRLCAPRRNRFVGILHPPIPIDGQHADSIRNQCCRLGSGRSYVYKF